MKPEVGNIGPQGGKIDLPEDPEVFKSLIESQGIEPDGTVPPLDPELVECLVEREVGTMINHPFVHTFYTPMANGMYNRMLRKKQRHFEQLVEEGNWWAALFVMLERPYRLERLIGLADRMGDKTYWELVADVWTDTENLHQNIISWRVALMRDRPGREYMMDKDERKALAELPDEFKVYRGTSAPNRKGAGYSWTLDREKGKWFARRLCLPGQTPYLLTGKVKKDDVIAYFDGRSEKEIVVFPEKVRILTMQEVKR